MTDQSTSGAAGGSASSFGTDQTQGGAGAQLRQAPASFSVPGFYGRGAQNFTVGEGRLARPKFRFTANISTGYDDNTLQTPTHPLVIPDQTVKVETAAATPATTVLQFVPSGDPNIPGSVQPVTVPGTPAKFTTVKVPGIPAEGRNGSFVTKVDGKWDIQMASRRTLFTFDLSGGVDYYWDRPGKKEDYTGELAMIYLHKLNGRTQFTFAIDESYQTQPDFSQPNLPTSNNVGPYLSSNLKADLSYRLTPRFSTQTSISYSALSYEDTTQSNSNYASTTFGTELRYLFSPRLTLVGELRYGSDMHANDSALDTTTYFALIGGELTLSRHFTSSLRLGEVVQSFKTDSSKQSSPYLEANLNYRLSQATLIGWNARYGYEESGAANTRNIVARSGLQLTQVFSPRLQANLSVNLVRSDSKTDATATTLASSQVQDTLDASLGFFYTLDRHWSLNLTYSYTTVIGPENFDDFYRQRIFMGASYQF